MDIDWTRIDRVLAGDASPEDIAAVEAWAARDPRHAALLAALRDPAATAEAAGGTDAAWQRLREAVVDDGEIPAIAGVTPLHAAAESRDRAADARHESESGREAAIVASPPAHPSRRVWLRAASIAMVGIGLAAVWRGTRQPQPVIRTASAVGSALTVDFDDGSSAILAPGARLSWVEPFSRDARTVTLDGEGLFDVMADADRPFLVDAAPVLVTVVGTRFVVRAWPERDRAEILVTEGIVRVSAGDGEQEVPADRSLVFADGVSTPGSGLDFAAETAWIDGRLTFVDAPLASVLPRLARRFDLTFVVADPALEARRVTASFDAPAADRVLDALALALGLRFVRDGRVVRVNVP